MTVEDKPEARMAFMILYWTGMRIGELLALEEHNATMQEVNEKWLDYLKNIEQDISSARKS